MSTRTQKYPDTSTFHYYNANPHNRFGGDCVVRAICTALCQTWEQTVEEMTQVGLKYGYVINDKFTIEKYLKLKGWQKQAQPRKFNKSKFTGKEFCKTLTTNQNIVANIGGHHTIAIVNGKVNDIWDCTNKTIGNYWIKED